MTVKKTSALGPNDRYAIWVQGCAKRCLGCISPDAQPLDAGREVDIRNLAMDILSTPDIEGVTISGGEPFLQSKALAELLGMLKSERDLGVIIYTGMLYEDVKDDILMEYCDILIDGVYQEAMNDGLSLRGSSNQRVIALTHRYDKRLDSYGKKGRKIEMHLNNDVITMVGIPDRETLEKLEATVFI